MEIRRLTIDDAPAWAALRREALETCPTSFGATMPDDPGQLVSTARERLAPSDDAAVFGALDGDDLVGVVGIRREPGIKMRHKGMIWGMYVTAAYRRTGVGEALLREAIATGRSWDGLALILLAVSASAPGARRLYERLGFRAWGREPRALYWQGEYFDETHMALDLSSPPM
jgi:ribosomal protein S18 acetylase RimI-like enzyme